MTSSRYQTSPLPENSFAKPYSGDSVLDFYYLNVYASGALFTNPEELSRLATMLINNGVYGSRRILSAQSVAAMAEDQRLGSFNPVPYSENRYGLGWDTVGQPGLEAVGVKAWHKSGDMSGYYGTSIIVLPEEKLGVVVFGASNSFDSSQAVKISERILLRALVERGRISGMPAQLSTAALPLKAVTAQDKATFAGYYGSGTTAYRLTFGGDDSLSVDEYRTDWTAKYQNLKLRSDGWFAADGDPVTAVRLLTRGGRNYFALRLKRGYGHYSINTLFGEQLSAKPAISAAWQASLAERWLPVNSNPSCFVGGTDAGFQFRTINGVTGYLMGNKILRDMDPQTDSRMDGMFFLLPDGGRDLEDAAIETWNAQSWLRLGSYLYQPVSLLPLLPAGATAVTVGSDGFTEWRRLPSSGTLSISGTTYWYLFDAGHNQLASGTTSGAPVFTGAGAKYVALFGPAGATINLNLVTP
jgi:hypothetical protein